MNRSDLRLYGILPVLDTGHVTAADLARRAVDGGATMIQIRDKAACARDIVVATRAVIAALRGTGVPVIVNDRADIAMAAGADGVHVGRDDLPVSEVRALLGSDAIVGATVRTEAEARAADLADADYVGLGGVFETQTKVNDTAPIGIAGVARVGALLRREKRVIGIVAIAGITAETAGAVVAAGADGVAVQSALFGGTNIETSAHALRRAVDEALAGARA